MFWMARKAWEAGYRVSVNYLRRHDSIIISFNYESIAINEYQLNVVICSELSHHGQ
jgi:hypothetical protein